MSRRLPWLRLLSAVLSEARSALVASYSTKGSSMRTFSQIPLIVPRE